MPGAAVRAGGRNRGSRSSATGGAAVVEPPPAVPADEPIHRGKRARAIAAGRTRASASAATSTTISRRQGENAHAPRRLQDPDHGGRHLLTWLERPPTKLVVVRIQRNRRAATEARRPFRQAPLLAKSLPHFLEPPAPRSGAADWPLSLSTSAHGGADRGVRRRRERQGLLRGRLRISVESRRRPEEARDWICPGVEEEGVAQAIEAYLDFRA